MAAEQELVAEVVPVYASPPAAIRKIELDRPWQWLLKGWQDLRRSPQVGVTYGLLAAITGYALTLGLVWADLLYLVLPLTAGFLIIGPILTVGLYEVSRRAELGQTTTVAQALAAFRRNGSQIALMGVALMLLMFAWARIAALIFFLYFGLQPPSFENLVASTFLQADTLPFLVFGTLVGGGMALLAFSISVVSIPLLLDRPQANVIDAIATSFRTVQTNFAPMLFWAVLIAGFTAAGLATLYLGLIVTLPLIGHATWHAYRDLVSFPAEQLIPNREPAKRDAAPWGTGSSASPWRCSALSACSSPAVRTNSDAPTVGFLLTAFGLAFIFWLIAKNTGHPTGRNEH